MNDAELQEIFKGDYTYKPWPFKAIEENRRKRMTTEPDYLAQIAAKTVECPCALTYLSDRCHACKVFGPDMAISHSPSCQIQGCKGSGRVLDPRFDGLRETKCSHGGHALTEDECGVYLKGYTVVRDLAVLLDIILPWDGAYEAVLAVFSDKDLHRYAIEGRGDKFTEAAAKAVWEWLEREEKVAT